MIDITKCIGCRMGVGLFTKEKGKYVHLDLFATPESGRGYKCANSELIGEHLTKNEDRGTYLPNEELTEIFKQQSFWWEDIIELAYVALKDAEKVEEFFNKGEKDQRMWNKSNIEIENELVDIAEKEGIDVSEEEYPDLLRWDKLEASQPDS